MANMHLVTGYAGTAHVTAADQGTLHTEIFGKGEFVFNKGNKLSASAISSNTVRVLDGDIMMQGRYIRLNEDNFVDLTIESGVQGVYRHDLIVARYTKDEYSGIEEVNLAVIKGAYAANDPADPAYTAGDILEKHEALNEMPLYRVILNGLNIEEVVPLFSVFGVIREHTHTKEQITNFPSSMPASDVYSWAKAATKPTYTASEVGAAAVSHGNHVPAKETVNNATFLRNDNTWQKVTPDNIGAAKAQAPNDMLHNGNEFTFVPAGHTGELYINYRTASGATDGKISNYHFGDGAGGEATLMANYFKGKFQGTDARLNYNGAEVAMLRDVPTKTKTLIFTYEDGTTETVEVYVK